MSGPWGGGRWAWVLGLVLLVGCPEGQRRPESTAPPAATLLEALHARAGVVRSLSAELRLEVWRGDERVKLRQLVAVDGVDRLRVDSLSPFGQPISTLAARDGRLAIYDLQTHRFYEGRATPENLARLLPIRLEPGEIGALLRGTVPVLAHQRATASHDAERDVDVLVLEGPAGRQTVDFERGGHRVVETRVHRDGQLRYVARLGRYDGPEAQATPRRVRFTAPEGEGELRVDIEVLEHRINPTLPDEAFTLDAPRGIPVESLDAEAPPPHLAP